MTTPVPLSKLVDLAIGTPEIGVVNFNILHTLLHAMLKQLNIEDIQTNIDSTDSDFLATVTQIKGLSTFSDKDISTDQKDAGTGKKARAPYHFLERKVEKLAQQLDELNALPSTEELFEQTKLEGKRSASDMWQYMQLKKKVDANEDGVGKLMSMIDNLMKEMLALKDINNELKNKVDDFNIEDLKRRLAEVEKCVHDMDDMKKRLSDLETFLNTVNEQLNSLPKGDELALQYVTWPGLEEALNGVRDEMGNLPVISKIFLESGMQTEEGTSSRPSTAKVSTRPPSGKSVTPQPSRSGSALSSSSSHSGPSPKLLELLEALGKLTDDHNALVIRVENLEKDMKNKLDKGALDNLNISTDLMDQLHKLMKDIEDIQNMHEKDNDDMKRIQHAILQLQAENEKLQQTAEELIKENMEKAKHLEELKKNHEKLDEMKADKEYVAMEVDVKADKKHLDGKVNMTLFDTTTNDLNKMIKEILDKLTGNEELWKDALKALENDLEGKLDRLELDSLKNWLEARLKALNKKINQASCGWTDDDAAGLRKQLLMKFHCLSCDRPIDMMPSNAVMSLPSPGNLPPNKSPRPYTTFELDQIRQQARKVYYQRTVANSSPRYQAFSSLDMAADPFAQERQCGGGHTLTYPHKRSSRMSQLNSLFKEESDVQPVKSEVDVQGVDGHIYKGRMERMSLEAKMRGTTGQQQSKLPSARPQMQKSQLGSVTRPMSARSPRAPQPNRNNVRPQSALPGSSRESVDSPRSSQMSGERPGSGIGDASGLNIDVPTPLPSQSYVE